MPGYDFLPPGVVPFLVSRETAAALIGVGTTKFDEMVRDGRMPAPREADARVLWDTDELRAACRMLPRRGAQAAPAGWDAA